MENKKIEVSVTKELQIMYLVLFFITWSGYELWGYYILHNLFTNMTVVVLDNVIKLSIWFLPSVYLIKKYSSNLYIQWHKMFTNSFTWSIVVPIVIVFTIFLLLTSWLSYGTISVNENFLSTDLLKSVLFVGITEEIVFRGWLLNASLKSLNKWFAIFLNALLFLAIHFPLWMATGIFMTTLLSGSFILVTVLSIIFSLSFIKSKNIFVPIILHMYWNLLVLLLM